MEDERMYNRREAGIIGRRELCENSEVGHQIERRVRQFNADGRICAELYACTICDVQVRLEYPPLGR